MTDCYSSNILHKSFTTAPDRPEGSAIKVDVPAAVSFCVHAVHSTAGSGVCPLVLGDASLFIYIVLYLSAASCPKRLQVNTLSGANRNVFLPSQNHKTLHII